MVIMYLVSFLASLLLSLILTRRVRDLALSRGWVTALSSHHIHRRPIPRLGGVAIFISFVAVAGILLAAGKVWGVDLRVKNPAVLTIFIPGGLIFLLGLYDDFCPLKPRVKFAVQAAAALMLYLSGVGKFGLPGLLGFEDSVWLTLPLTIFWVLLITNAYNLIDGLDGLAAGSSFISMLTICIISLIGGYHMGALLALVLAGATLGFLRFNFNPATIFLGDSGSLFLGFMLSALALAGSQKTSTVVTVALPIVSFGVPLLETALSVIRRFLRGQPLFTADCEHIHHKLLERGLTHRQAVIILYSASALCGLLSLFLLKPGNGVIAVALFTLGAGVWMGVKGLGYQEFDELGRVAHRAIDQKRVIANNLALRRAATKLAKAQSFLQICSTLQEAFEAGGFDGYQLSLWLDPDPSPLASELGLARERRSERNLAWHKPLEEGEGWRSLAPVWSLTLELEMERNNRRGSLTVYRLSNDRPLRVDLGLLSSEFKVALEKAVERHIGVYDMRERRWKRAADSELPAAALHNREGHAVNYG